MPRTGYVASIRERIGNDLLLLPAAVVLARDRAGRVLLARSADVDQWITIGGAIEPDEAPADAARREAMEEAAIEVRLDRLLAAVGGPGYRVSYPNGDEVAPVSFVYEATIVSGEPTPDGVETTDTRWFTLAELADADLNPFARTLFTELAHLL